MFGANYFGQAYFGQGSAISGNAGLYNLVNLAHAATKYLNGARRTEALNHPRATKFLNGARVTRRVD